MFPPSVCLLDLLITFSACAWSLIILLLQTVLSLFALTQQNIILKQTENAGRTQRVGQHVWKEQQSTFWV